MDLCGRAWILDGGIRRFFSRPDGLFQNDIMWGEQATRRVAPSIGVGEDLGRGGACNGMAQHAAPLRRRGSEGGLDQGAGFKLAEAAEADELLGFFVP